jgi:NitT/TauT family transport system ATP-binding protein
MWSALAGRSAARTAIAVLALVILVADTITDLEIAVAAFYVVIVLLSVSVFERRGVMYVLLCCVGHVLSGLMETVANQPYNGHADLPDIASTLQMEINELFPASEALSVLHFAELAGGDLRLTGGGQRFAIWELQEHKQMFADALRRHVPLAAHIRKVLDERASHRAPRSRFSDELEDHMSEEEAELTLRAITSWARYAELFFWYDDQSGQFTLEKPT